jgi:uncharacterized protein (DUF1330 family)
MAAYLVVDSHLTDPTLYEQYKLQAKPLAEKHGGEYLARGGNMVVKESALWSPTRMVLIRFPSMEQAQGFYDSAEYQKALEISKQSAQRSVVIVEGV